MNVNTIIKEGRQRLGLSEAAFAARCGVSRASVQHWERPGGQAPNRARQPIVAAVLGISPAELMQGIPPAPADLSPRALRMARMFDDLAHDKQAQRVAYATLVSLSNTPGADELDEAKNEGVQPLAAPKQAQPAER